MRSSVEPRADTMRIGVAAASSSRRTARMTARPSSSGSIRSRTTSAGRWRSMASSAAGPSAAVTTAKPVALEVGPHEADDLGVVVDDEDRSLGDRRGGLGRHRKHGRGARVGRSRDGPVTGEPAVATEPIA